MIIHPSLAFVMHPSHLDPMSMPNSIPSLMLTTHISSLIFAPAVLLPHPCPVSVSRAYLFRVPLSTTIGDLHYHLRQSPERRFNEER
jgi:hypothetical protein